eukprot:1138656-Pelagomonas_calceolata.AAC.9
MGLGSGSCCAMQGGCQAGAINTLSFRDCALLVTVLVTIVSTDCVHALWRIAGHANSLATMGSCSSDVGGIVAGLLMPTGGAIGVLTAARPTIGVIVTSAAATAVGHAIAMLTTGSGGADGGCDVILGVWTQWRMASFAGAGPRG